jgi:hypothetical protein
MPVHAGAVQGQQGKQQEGKKGASRPFGRKQVINQSGEEK